MKPDKTAADSSDKTKTNGKSGETLEERHARPDMSSMPHEARDKRTLPGSQLVSWRCSANSRGRHGAPPQAIVSDCYSVRLSGWVVSSSAPQWEMSTFYLPIFFPLRNEEFYLNCFRTPCHLEHNL